MRHFSSINFSLNMIKNSIMTPNICCISSNSSRVGIGGCCHSMLTLLSGVLACGWDGGVKRVRRTGTNSTKRYNVPCSIAPRWPRSVVYEQQWPKRFNSVTICVLPVRWCADMPSSICFGIFHTPLLVAAQMSSAIDDAILSVLSLALAPVFFFFPDTMSSIKSLKTAGGAWTSDCRNSADGGHGSVLQSFWHCKIYRRVDFATVVNIFFPEDADSKAISTAAPTSMSGLKTSSLRLAVFQNCSWSPKRSMRQAFSLSTWKFLTGHQVNASYLAQQCKIIVLPRSLLYGFSSLRGQALDHLICDTLLKPLSFVAEKTTVFGKQHSRCCWWTSWRWTFSYRWWCGSNTFIFWTSGVTQLQVWCVGKCFVALFLSSMYLWNKQSRNVCTNFIQSCLRINLLLSNTRCLFYHLKRMFGEFRNSIACVMRIMSYANEATLVTRLIPFQFLRTMADNWCFIWHCNGISALTI